MSSTILLKTPTACDGEELLEFERMVRLGFHGSDESLPTRIRSAALLAFHSQPDGRITAVAALKSPAETYRAAVFENAGATDDPADYQSELGWVFVLPGLRGSGVASLLCRQLVTSAEGSGIFATTRPDNTPMIRVLTALAFSRVGRPYARGSEHLALFLRPGTSSQGCELRP